MKKFISILSKNFSFLILILSLISFSFINVPRKADIKIYWSKDKLLTWEDFDGKPIKASPDAAITDSGFEFMYSYSGSEHLLVFDLQTYFIKNKSWVKADKKKEHLLKHEQGHFDIPEIFSRKFRKDIIEEKFKEKGFDKKLKELNTKYANDIRKYQELYDKETDHSKNEQKQAEWDKKIEKELKESEKFSESHFTKEVK